MFSARETCDKSNSASNPESGSDDAIFVLTESGTESESSKYSGRFVPSMDEILLESGIPFQGNCFHQAASISDTQVSRDQIISRIENVIQEFVENLVNGKSPVLTFRNREWSNCTFEDDVVCLKPVSEAQMSEVKMTSKRSTAKFSLIMHLLAKIYRTLLEGASCTKRELFYQNVSLVKSQSAIDSAVRDICCMLDVPSWELGITATSKGLISGHLTITTAENNNIDCMNAGGILLPQDVHGIKNMETTAKFILVIEKDATFQKLLDEGALTRLGPCILITGKGFPDVNTRLMVKKLWEAFALPVFGLVDADPHGIEIMCTYRFGSLANAHQSDRLAVPSMRWLGVRPSDISRLQVPSLSLSHEDISKVKDLINRPYIQTNALIMDELNILLKDKRKAEIEGVGNISPSYLTDAYVPNKLASNDYI